MFDSCVFALIQTFCGSLQTDSTHGVEFNSPQVASACHRLEDSLLVRAGPAGRSVLNPVLGAQTNNFHLVCG
jgi:hypothetical protein